eukprot:scaffold2247_cov346-Ochromonas_danica.AAC.3
MVMVYKVLYTLSSPTPPHQWWLSYFSHYCLTTKAIASFSLLGLQSFPSRIIAVTLLGFCQRLCQRICRHLFSLEVLNGYDLISYEIFKSRVRFSFSE